MKRKELKAIPVLHLERERYIFPQKLGLRQRAAAKRFYTTSDDVLKKALPHVDLDTVGPITLQYTPTSSHMTAFRLVCIGLCCHVLMRVPCVHVIRYNRYNGGLLYVSSTGFLLLKPTYLIVFTKHSDKSSVDACISTIWHLYQTYQTNH